MLRCCVAVLVTVDLNRVRVVDSRPAIYRTKSEAGIPLLVAGVHALKKGSTTNVARGCDGGLQGLGGEGVRYFGI